MTQDSIYPQETDRRDRRITKSVPRDNCPKCGGVLRIIVRGRDRRYLCLGCNKNPEQCGCMGQ